MPQEPGRGFPPSRCQTWRKAGAFRVYLLKTSRQLVLNRLFEALKRTGQTSTTYRRLNHDHPGLPPRIYLRTGRVARSWSSRCFALERGLRVAARYVENESGAKLHRPELFRLLADCEPGDVLLVEQVDRLSRLTSPDWQRLRNLIDAKQVRIVALDLPTSWSLTAPGDEFTARMFAAVNSMSLDVVAAVARKDYEDRRRRQAEGFAKAKAAGLYRGRPGK